MKSVSSEKIIPAQYTGSRMDAVEERKMEDLATAENLFQAASNRLLDVNKWGEIAGMSAFLLMDSKGYKVQRKAEKGDYIRIDIPGPGPGSGKGYDWVKIEDIIALNEDQEQILAMTVRPSEFPLSHEKVTAHFLKNEATSTFLIRRKGTVITAEEHGRNEKPNISEGDLIDRGRNLVVGLAAKMGLSYPQWKSLVIALLDGHV